MRLTNSRRMPTTDAGSNGLIALSILLCQAWAPGVLLAQNSTGSVVGTLAPPTWTLPAAPYYYQPFEVNIGSFPSSELGPSMNIPAVEGLVLAPSTATSTGLGVAGGAFYAETDSTTVSATGLHARGIAHASGGSIVVTALNAHARNCTDPSDANCAAAINPGSAPR